MNSTVLVTSVSINPLLCWYCPIWCAGQTILSVLICYATHFSVVWISSSICFFICNVHLLAYIVPYYHLINICRWEVGRYNCLKMRKLWWRQTELLMWRKTSTSKYSLEIWSYTERLESENVRVGENRRWWTVEPQ